VLVVDRSGDDPAGAVVMVQPSTVVAVATPWSISNLAAIVRLLRQ
jgi:hypothetical protein